METFEAIEAIEVIETIEIDLEHITGPHSMFQWIFLSEAVEEGFWSIDKKSIVLKFLKTFFFFSFTSDSSISFSLHFPLTSYLHLHSPPHST